MTELEALISIASVAFVATDKDKPFPQKHFAIPPYSIMPMNDKYPNGYCGVANALGFNCLSFENKPGAKFAPRAVVEDIVNRWNAEAKLKEKNT